MKPDRKSPRRDRLRSLAPVPHCIVILLTLSLLTISIFSPYPFLSFADALTSSEKKLNEKANKLIANGGYIVTRHDTIIAQRKPDQSFTPASILKIATSAAALHTLGRDYRFTTTFFQNKEGDLFIKGHGDPFLTSEEISIISGQLITLGLKPFTRIIIDNSSYSLDSQNKVNGKSPNPYDAEISALSVNFNTINIEVSISGEISSAEEQTPDLPIMTKYGKNYSKGKYRIAVNDTPAAITKYAGQLFNSLLHNEFIKNRQMSAEPDNVKIQEGLTPEGLSPFYVHTSTKKLTEIIKPMLRYSNNIIANHLFLTCGAVKFGYPATWEKGRNAIRQFLQTEIGLKNNSFKINEGSGLSRSNRITPTAMLEILEFFKPDMNLLPTRRGAFLKSGTLTGVYAYAGYFPDSDPFVLILNQKSNNRKALLKLLTKYHNLTQHPQ